jgi:hypothetical protein
MPDPKKEYDDDEAHVIRTWELNEPTLTPTEGTPLTWEDWLEFVKKLGKAPDDH